MAGFDKSGLDTQVARIFAICNQKGGVGKTSVTLGLADAIARQGGRCLVIDADPQASATSALGVESPPFSLNDVLGPRDGMIEPGVIVEAVVPAGEGWHGVDLVGSELGLAEREQDQNLGREARLKTAIGDAFHRWDVILVDCPPSLGQLTVNALVAADGALVVTEPRASSVDGVAQIVRTAKIVRTHYNEYLSLAGIVVNRYRPDRVDSRHWHADLRGSYGAILTPEAIPEREVISQATSEALPFSAYGGRGREVAEVFDRLADRFIQLGVAK